MRWGIKGKVVTPGEVIPGMVVVRESRIEGIFPHPGNEDLEVVYDFKDSFIFLVLWICTSMASKERMLPKVE